MFFFSKKTIRRKTNLLYMVPDQPEIADSFIDRKQWTGEDIESIEKLDARKKVGGFSHDATLNSLAKKNT